MSTVAFDIGGTFTDIIALGDDGTVVVDKVLSAPDLLTVAVDRIVTEALRRGGTDRLTALLHGTTVASNALLERKGARIALLTTRGFRDELDIRRESRPAVYDFGWRRPPALVPRRLRLEVDERIDADGSIRRPLNEAELKATLHALALTDIEALAICFVNSYVDPVHEHAAAELARQLLPGVLVTTSHDLLPQVREYERMSTTAVNAYLAPVVATYLQGLVERFENRTAAFRIMQSNGGLSNPALVARAPVRIVESGPAAGVVAAAALCRELGIDRAVAFDMGGTTVKACLIDEGRPVERTDYEVGGEAHGAARYSHGAGYAVSVPSYDIVEAGAGGGSIARMEDGALRVGPISAGAMPGPVAYGRGGTAPTVTDANVVLGYLNHHAIADGSVTIDRAAAAAAISTLDPAQSAQRLAYGVHQVANAAMMRSIKAVTSERGRDPREYTLIAFGGAGPVHAVALAGLTGLRRVVIPPAAGLFSALGLLVADLRYDATQTWNRRLGEPGFGDNLAQEFDRLRTRIADTAVSEDIDPESLVYTREVDLRYAGQSEETTIELSTTVDSGLADVFHDEHESRYGYRFTDEPIVAVTLRLNARARATTRLTQACGVLARRPMTIASATRLAYFGEDHGELAARVLSRVEVAATGPYSGPAIVEEPDTTVVIPPGWSARVDALGNLVVETESGGMLAR